MYSFGQTSSIVLCVSDPHDLARFGAILGFVTESDMDLQSKQLTELFPKPRLPAWWRCSTCLFIHPVRLAVEGSVFTSLLYKSEVLWWESSSSSSEVLWRFVGHLTMRSVDGSNVFSFPFLPFAHNTIKYHLQHAQTPRKWHWRHSLEIQTLSTKMIPSQSNQFLAHWGCQNIPLMMLSATVASRNKNKQTTYTSHRRLSMTLWPITLSFSRTTIVSNITLPPMYPGRCQLQQNRK